MSNNQEAEQVNRRKWVSINRPAYSQKEFENEFAIANRDKTPTNQLIKNEIKKVAFKFHPKNLIGIFTILNLITEYDFKKNLVSDILSGITGCES